MILPKKVGSRFQMDLIEMPYSQGYRYILRVVDHMSCFGYVAPVKFKEAEEIGKMMTHLVSKKVQRVTMRMTQTKKIQVLQLQLTLLGLHPIPPVLPS